MYKEMVLSKKSGVSFSAGQALQYRWIMHYFNTRPDPLSVAFTKKTLFLWQSVSLYLEADIVKDTLKAMTDLCTDGSIIAQDFYSKAFSLGANSMAVKSQKNLIEKMGEPWKFGIDMSNDPKAAVESFLKECGLKLTEYIQFGEKLGIKPFYCIVEAEKM